MNAPSHRDIIFTRNATEAINLVAYSWALPTLKKGDEVSPPFGSCSVTLSYPYPIPAHALDVAEDRFAPESNLWACRTASCEGAGGSQVCSRFGVQILLSVAEHHSNLVPWQMVAQKTGAVLKFAMLDAEEGVDGDHLLSLISPKTKLVSLAHVSNTLGMHQRRLHSLVWLNPQPPYYEP